MHRRPSAGGSIALHVGLKGMGKWTTQPQARKDLRAVVARHIKARWRDGGRGYTFRVE